MIRCTVSLRHALHMRQCVARVSVALESSSVSVLQARRCNSDGGKVPGQADSEHEVNSASSSPPPPPPLPNAPEKPMKRGKTPFLLELERMKTAPASGFVAEPSQPESPAEPARATFLSRLSQLRRNNAEQLQPSIKASEARKLKKAKAIESARKSLLVFRDVGMDLDRAILSRDVLLIPKYFYYGIEFAVDNELERMLRYFHEHAMNEMKLINDGKLLRGPERLGKGGFDFPTIENLTRLHTLLEAPGGAAAAVALSTGGSSNFAEWKQVPYTPPPNTTSKAAATASSGRYAHLACGTFRKPTMVIFTQLGQKMGGQADRMWRDIAVEFVDPKFSAKLRGKRSLDSVRGNDDAGSVSAAGSPSAHVALHATKPVDVLSVRCMDVQKYGWVHRLYVKRFLQALLTDTFTTACVQTTGGSGKEGKPTPISDDKDVRTAYSRWLLQSTVVGHHTFAPFFPHGIRNYLCPTVMLVDHKGRVRWISGGLPEAKEKATVPKLLQQLCVEYYRDQQHGSNLSSP